MGPFTNRQTAYIRAIAGQSKHKSYIVSNVNTVGGPGSGLSGSVFNYNGSPFGSGESMAIAHFELNETPYGLDSRPANVNNDLTSWVPTLTNVGFGTGHTLRCLHCPVDTEAGGSFQTDGAEHTHYDRKITSTEWRTSKTCFLESTHMRFRFVMPDTYTSTESGHSMQTPHYEWRFIIFRNKRATYRPDDEGEGMNTSYSQLMDGVSLANPAYDLFMGQAGRYRGTLGWRANDKLDEELNYTATNQTANDESGATQAYCGKYWNGTAWADGLNAAIAPPGEDMFSASDYMTAKLNRNDYVIHTDERFFLGSQFGKSHFEKEIRFDWKDFIDTQNDDLTSSPTLDGKNYEWRMVILGTSNGTVEPYLNVNVRSTTYLTSGE